MWRTSPALLAGKGGDPCQAWGELRVPTTPPAQAGTPIPPWGPPGPARHPPALHAGLFRACVDSCPPWTPGAGWSVTAVCGGQAVWPRALQRCCPAAPGCWGCHHPGNRASPARFSFNILLVATEIGFPRFAGQQPVTVGSFLKRGQFADFVFASLRLVSHRASVRGDDTFFSSLAPLCSALGSCSVRSVIFPPKAFSSLE